MKVCQLTTIETESVLDLTVIIRAYKDDYDLIASWLFQRNIDLWQKSYVPKVGFVATVDEKPVAMGFIRDVEGNLCMLDGLITDPTQLPEVRNKAIDSVVKKLIDTAKELNYMGMIALTVEETVIKRSLRHNFIVTNQAVIALDLRS